MGRGAQWVSWVSLDDLVGVILFALVTPELVGAVNVVAPGAVRNRELARALGTVLHRPARIPLPARAIRAVLGTMGEELLLTGARVRPARLSRAGFEFFFPTLEEALRHELGRP